MNFLPIHPPWSGRHIPRTLYVCVIAAVILFVFSCPSAMAARIGEISETNIGDQVYRFFTLQDPSVRYTIAGCILLGTCCGMLGSFIVVRKMALMGDALSHAVLPGVALGFLWTMEKNPLYIFVGATIAGLIGTATVSAIKRTTRLKEDTALGIVLASFYAVGICLLTYIQHLPTGNKSGIDKFLFGQAAAMGREDLILMAVVCVICLVMVYLFYKELLALSFDTAFARSLGLNVDLLHHMLMLLLSFAVVISLKAVGVVLVSAMLITPAATAYLLTERLSRMIGIAIVVGMVSGIAGAFFSFLGNNLPTGPFIVLAASLFFVGAFLFAPKHGVILRWWRTLNRRKRTIRENMLKSIYHVLEQRGFDAEGVSTRELAEQRRETVEDVEGTLRELNSHSLITRHEDGNITIFTPDGWQRAATIVRNHRLWELYLTNEASIAADHVHDDAEIIEHVLGEETVMELQKRLDYANLDPHGKHIPTREDIEQRGRHQKPGTLTSGYGGQV
ncbi:MAG: iron chelate uptake ABC transporter family permease subunit [Verrucomicrobiota bacterium]|nr:iron chelate uptake ABC transporter family permease subunit [Verrucomicrobiota bacterium]